MLFLTACGGGNTPTLTCSEEGKVTVKIFYEEDEKIPKSVDASLKRIIPEGISNEQKEIFIEQYKKVYCSDSSLKCDIKKSDNYIVINISGSIDQMINIGALEVDKDDDLSLDALKERAENNGAKCTKSYE